MYEFLVGAFIVGHALIIATCVGILVHAGYKHGLEVYRGNKHDTQE